MILRGSRVQLVDVSLLPRRWKHLSRYASSLGTAKYLDRHEREFGPIYVVDFDQDLPAKKGWYVPEDLLVLANAKNVNCLKCLYSPDLLVKEKKTLIEENMDLDLPF